jgi:hypothetical protein
MNNVNDYVSVKEIKDKMYVYAYRIKKISTGEKVTWKYMSPIVQPFTQQYADIIKTKNNDSFDVYKKEKNYQTNMFP